VTKGGENRLATLRKWCEDELLEHDLEHEHNLFRFTSLNQVEEIDKRIGEAGKREELDIDPYKLFLSPVWYKPFHEEPETLLWRPK
jgi:hypothetical protein